MIYYLVADAKSATPAHPKGANSYLAMCQTRADAERILQEKPEATAVVKCERRGGKSTLSD